MRLFDWGTSSPTPAGFAVVDLETTGLYPTKDRIVEVAVVHVDTAGKITDNFCTIVDPKRDVGPTHIHGLTATSVLGAPTFREAAPSIWKRLTGRVFVAHNARFDLGFLEAELSRCGMHLPPPPVMCTMQLSSSYLVGLPSRSLTSCCEAAGVSLATHHSALEDALAAAQLLACFRTSHRRLPPSWEEALRAATITVWAAVAPLPDVLPVTRVDQVARRASERAPLADVVHRLPRGSGGDVEHYLGVLDRVLEDRFVSNDEVAELLQLAMALGVTKEDAERAHREYLLHVAAAACDDGEVTQAERADLIAVAGMLGVPVEDALDILETPHGGRLPPIRPDGLLRPGDRVVFTGEMEHGREALEKLARSAGLRVMSAVSARTALLVVADPHSQSAKARTARQLGIRVVTELVFLHLLPVKGDTDEPNVRPGTPQNISARLMTEVALSGKDRGPGWEYLMLAAVLQAGVRACEDRYHNFQIGSVGPPGRRLTDLPEALRDIASQVRKMGATFGEIGRLLSPQSVEAAVGKPGEDGDPDRIRQLASGIAEVYDGTLTWAAEIRATDCPQEARKVYWAASWLVARPLDEIRTFADRFDHDIRKLVGELRTGASSSFSIPAELKLDTDPVAMQAFKDLLAELATAALWVARGRTAEEFHLSTAVVAGRGRTTSSEADRLSGFTSIQAKRRQRKL